MIDQEEYSESQTGYRAGAAETAGRVMGSPLPMGNGGRSSSAGEAEEHPTPPPGRALTNQTEPVSAIDRALGVVRMAIPLVQRLLPLLDGNVAAAVASLFSQHHQPGPAQQKVDLEPVENSLAELKNQHRELRAQVGEQNTALKRVEDQLDMVREATDRNTLEQQELLEDLKAVGNKVNLFAVFALGLLAISIIVNVILYLHIRRVLP